MLKNIWNWQMLDIFHSLRTTQISTLYAMDCSLLSGQFKRYESYRNMFTAFRRRSWPHLIESCSLNIRISTTSSAKTSKKLTSKAAKGNTTDVKEQGVYLQKKKQDAKPELMGHVQSDLS